MIDTGVRTWQQLAHGYQVGIWDEDELPKGWFFVSRPPWPWRHVAQEWLTFKSDDPRHPLLVLITASIREDGRPWLHVSLSHPERVPDYWEMAEVKDDFIGSDRKAIMVYPPKRVHVNIHPHCLHLWHCLEGDPLPEFSAVIDGVRMV